MHVAQRDVRSAFKSFKNSEWLYEGDGGGGGVGVEIKASLARPA